MERANHYSTTKKIFGGISLAYVAVFVYMLVFRPLPEAQYTAFFNLYQAFPPLFAGIAGVWLSLAAKGFSKARRIGWFCIGAACLSFAIGQSTWFYLESVKGIEVPFPGAADAGYLGMVPFMFAGVLLLVNSGQAANKFRQFMDSAIVVSAFASLSWYFIIQHSWNNAELNLFGRCVSVAYPMGDIAIMFVAMAAIMGSATDRVLKRGIGLVAIGILLVTFSDSAFTYLSLKDQYFTGSPYDWGWSFGWLTIGWASLYVFWNRDQVGVSEATFETRKERPFVVASRVYGPYVAVAVSFLVVVVHDLRSFGQLNLQKHGELLGLVALILVRQVFMVLENVKLAEKVQTMNDGLETLVRARTRQLESLQELSKAVNSTLDFEDVLDAALSETQAALAACGATLWIRSVDDSPHAISKSRGRGLDEHAELVTFMSTLECGDAPVQASVQDTPDGPMAHVLVAQISWHGEHHGKIAVVKWDEGFDADDCSLMQSIGLELGTALRNAEQHAIAVDNADHDSVTELLNHRAFQQRIENLLNTARDTESVVSVMVTDLDNFKLFNDTYGHLVGDEVLRTVGRAINQCVPEDAVVARFGGDEFVVALPGIDADSAQLTAKMITQILAEEGYRQANDDRVIPIGISIGIAMSPIDGKNRHELLMVADRNLYEAKMSGAGIAASTDEQRTNRALKAYGSFETLDALITAVDNKDRYTRKHSEEVTEYALWIAEEIGLSEETMRQLRVAGLLHDVGKIGVPDEILRKPGRLSPEEFEIMQRHPRLGALIVGAIPGMTDVVDGVRCHHERWDGQGYPDQLHGTDTPLFGRILAVADAFSAMTTDRPYRAGMDWSIALQNIQSGMGTQFDPEMAAAFLKAAKKRAVDRIEVKRAA